MNSQKRVTTMSFGINVQETSMPTTLLLSLYAEYDGLLDALDAVRRKLRATRRFHAFTYKKLQRQRQDLCDALADVHEKIAEFDFVAM